MKEDTTAFGRMVAYLVDNYGMSQEGAEKLVVTSSETIYTTREQIRYKNAQTAGYSADQARELADQNTLIVI